MVPRPLKIGLSARLMHAPPSELGFRGKTLQYLEQSIAHWIMSHGAIVLMIPTLGSDAGVSRRGISVRSYVRELDGLVLQGGADVSPRSYGKQPMRADWAGDIVRDRYEMQLVEAFIDAGKPVLGICRGHQLINVAFGGTLRRDMADNPALIAHHAPSEATFTEYFEHIHPVNLVEGGVLERAYKTESLDVVSVHYQGVDKLGAGLTVEATAPDGVVEAISANMNGAPVLAVQWHPEWKAHENPQSQTFFKLLGRALRREPLVAG